MRNYFAEYPENSRSAILRVAILVAQADGSWHVLERERLETVYRNICNLLDADLDDDLLLEELDLIATDVPDEIRKFETDEEREAYWQKCLAPIVSRDIQHTTVMAALRLAGGDGEIQPKEAASIGRLRQTWDVSLEDASEYWG